MSAGAWVSAPISTAMFPWPSISEPLTSWKARPGGPIPTGLPNSDMTGRGLPSSTAYFCLRWDLNPPTPKGSGRPGEVLVTSAQIRAARGLLDWTVRDLAERSGVHRDTVSAGVEFTNGDAPGVKLRKR